MRNPPRRAQTKCAQTSFCQRPWLREQLNQLSARHSKKQAEFTETQSSSPLQGLSKETVTGPVYFSALSALKKQQKHVRATTPNEGQQRKSHSRPPSSSDVNRLQTVNNTNDSPVTPSSLLDLCGPRSYQRRLAPSLPRTPWTQNLCRQSPGPALD